ncbi:DUF4198 domain-containing protein [Loktanella sp. S4079]|uniref:DUF4198 domain-containing protein n=1 Tax=Loktanella sp. S4079 TaxID=579483 RepID=UPI0005FA44E8|nr:DUF4198 domain-containing protein [Loktanella sp. S4079]KJZ20164.1 hypothetical protein TW80_04830 [Loktanella sp. S4079]
MRIFAFLFSVIAMPAVAHEFWLEPIAYQIDPDGSLEAHIVNGQNFVGTRQVYLPQRLVHFVNIAGETGRNVEGRMGDRPALNQAPVAEGLNVVAYQSTNATVDYATWEKFQNFVDHKDFGDVLSRQRARGLPEADFKEIYSRYSKTLIAVGDGAGQDLRVGLETEIVALNNPYTDDLQDGMTVQVFYRHDPRADVQVEVFEKQPDGAVAVTYHRTNTDGIAQFPVIAGNSYMVDAVVLREPAAAIAAETGAVWETLWANLTFAVPK